MGSISVTEFNNAKLQLVKLTQNESFHKEVMVLKNKKCCFTIYKPIIVINTILEWSRITKSWWSSSLTYNERHPLLLDQHHPLSKLIFQFQHLQMHHAGPQLLLTYQVCFYQSLLLEIVWSVSDSLIMTDLPKHRVEITPPFSITGLDYAALFILKYRKGRGCKTFKTYIC